MKKTLLILILFCNLKDTIGGIGPSGNYPIDISYGTHLNSSFSTIGQNSINRINQLYSLNIWINASPNANNLRFDGMLGFSIIPHLNFNDSPQKKSGYHISYYLHPIGFDIFSKKKTIDLISSFGVSYGGTYLRIENERYNNQFYAIVTTLQLRKLLGNLSLGLKLDGLLDWSTTNWSTTKGDGLFKPKGFKQHSVQMSITLGYKFKK